jgi:hypothetical protein
MEERSRMNFSGWNIRRHKTIDIAKVIHSSDKLPAIYLPTHPTVQPTAAEKNLDNQLDEFVEVKTQPEHKPPAG